jgi:hypothetical protein
VGHSPGFYQHKKYASSLLTVRPDRPIPHFCVEVIHHGATTTSTRSTDLLSQFIQSVIYGIWSFPQSDELTRLYPRTLLRTLHTVCWCFNSSRSSTEDGLCDCDTSLSCTYPAAFCLGASAVDVALCRYSYRCRVLYYVDVGMGWNHSCGTSSNYCMVDTDRFRRRGFRPTLFVDCCNSNTVSSCRSFSCQDVTSKIDIFNLPIDSFYEVRVLEHQ